MKTKIFLFSFVLLSCKLLAQDQIPDGFTGIYEIVLGAKFSEVKKFLDPKPVYSLAEKREAEEAGQSAPDKEGWGEPKTWTVQKAQKKFFTYMAAPVTSIEVTFDDSNKVSHIRVLIPKNEENETKVREGSFQKFGNTDGAVGADSDQFYFPWEIGDYKYSISNWDVLAPEPIDYEKETFMYVDFRAKPW